MTLAEAAPVVKPVRSAPARSTAQTAPRLSGTFIQFQAWMMKMKREEWTRELDSLRNAGLTTIIVQWAKFDTDHFFPGFIPRADPLKWIFEYADRNNMKVYLGLHFDSAWWKEWDDEDFLNRSVKKTAKLAKTLSRKYGRHDSFAGWYLPYEMSDADFEDDSLALLHSFFTRATKAAKDARNKPVTVSVFFNAKYWPEIAADTFVRVFKDSGIDAFLVQDGVGANSWTTRETMNDIVVPYLTAFRTVARASGAELWGVAELFASVRDANGAVTERVPQTIATLKDQLHLEAPLVDELVGFDAFHYMNPNRSEATRRLYQGYMSEVLRVKP